MLKNQWTIKFKTHLFSKNEREREREREREILNHFYPNNSQAEIIYSNSEFGKL